MNRLLLAYHPQILAHDAGPDHPERAKRVTAILDAVAEAQWRDAVEIVTARQALPEEISLVHDSRYVNAMRRLCDAGGAYLTEMEANVGSDSYPAALYSVGCGLTLAERIMAGDYKIGFAPTRPPGHHSVLNRPRGSCIFKKIPILRKSPQRSR